MMNMHRRKARLGRVTLAVATAALAAAGLAAAFQALPPGGQVNDDPAAGINKALSVSGEDPANADVVGGALVAGKPGVPWSIFRQQEDGTSQPHDQIFSRSFAAGAWLTRGNGTVGGRSSASPDVQRLAELRPGPERRDAGDRFRRRRRTVPWATWYESTAGSGFGQNNVFASRFDSTQNKWIFAGQGRGTGGIGSVPVPSLNIHTDQSAENPSVAGGSAADATKPGPWVTWQETTTASDQRAGSDLRQPAARPGPGQLRRRHAGRRRRRHRPRPGHRRLLLPADRRPDGSAPAAADPSLNIDPDPRRRRARHRVHGQERRRRAGRRAVGRLVREGRHQQPASAGSPTTTRWCSRPRASPTRHPGTAASTGPPSVTTNSALLDASGTNHFGGCAASDAAEAGCSLNKNPNADAEDPRVAAGTMNPANATVPWVDLGRARERRAADLRLPAGRRHALRAGQQRRTDLDRRQRLDPSRHHVLGQHAVRVVA